MTSTWNCCRMLCSVVDLGQSVQNVRRFQNGVRKEVLDTGGKPDYREIAKRQFQINDMLLSLLQELATRAARLCW